MGAKRQFEEVDSQGSDHAAGASDKRQKSYVGRKRKALDDSGAKKRARAIERSLRRNPDVPVNVRIDLERELAAQKQTIEDKAYKKKRSTMISRYHMVRFFERKKASRLVKQLKRKLEQESDPSEAEKMRKDLHIAEVDEAYTLYFPHLETYVSLYGAAARSDAEEQTAEEKLAAAKAALKAERPPMWAVIEKALAEGPAALQKLRDRRSPADSGEVDDSRPPIRPPPPSAAPTSTPASRPVPVQKKHETQEKQVPAKKSRSSDNNKEDRGSQDNKANQDNRINKDNKDNKGQQPELNRRERRRLMREAAAAGNGDGDEDGGGFFEGL